VSEEEEEELVVPTLWQDFNINHFDSLPKVLVAMIMMAEVATHLITSAVTSSNVEAALFPQQQQTMIHCRKKALPFTTTFKPAPLYLVFAKNLGRQWRTNPKIKKWALV
jgi:hypothetical protein